MNDEYLLNKRILLVDDESELLNMVLSILIEYGFQNVRTAKSVKEAIEEAEKSHPELVILDVMLPDGNGFDLMEQLKKSDDYPILFLTACGEDDDKFKGFGLGADDYMIKPFLPKELSGSCGLSPGFSGRGAELSRPSAHSQVRTSSLCSAAA